MRDPSQDRTQALPFLLTQIQDYKLKEGNTAQKSVCLYPGQCRVKEERTVRATNQHVGTARGSRSQQRKELQDRMASWVISQVPGIQAVALIGGLTENSICFESHEASGV